VGLSAGAYAQVTISAGFALSSVKATYSGHTWPGETGMGGNIYIDYLLPVGVPLSLGAEVGADNATLKDEGDGYGSITVTVIPILARVAYHFDLNPKLDLYLVGKVGYAFGQSDDFDSDAEGMAFGADIGAAYYLSANFGLFAEAGFDKYALAITDGYNVAVPFSRFLTAGISLKL
jgi:hypothetical protein